MAEFNAEAWIKEAGTLEVSIPGSKYPLEVRPKRFKSGSLGWYCSEKVRMSDTRMQVSICITVIGSKPAPEDKVVDNGPLTNADGLEYASSFLEPPEEAKTPTEPARKPGRGKKQG